MSMPAATAPRTVLAAALAAMLGALPVWLVSATSVLLRDELGLTEARLGVAVSTYFVVSAAAAWPSGRLADRLGARRALAAAVALTSAVVVALVTLAGDWWHVAGLLGVAGVASALVQPATNVAVVGGVSSGRQGLALGIKQAAIPAATLAAGAAVPTIALVAGWRAALALPLVLAVGFAGLWPALPAGRASGARLAETDGGGRGRVPLLVLTLAAGLGVAATISASAFLVPALVDGGLGPGTAGWILSGASLAGVTVRVASGWTADRVGGSGLPGVAALMAAGSVGALMVATVDATPLIALGAALMLGAGWGWNGLFILSVVRAFPASPGRATGLTQVGVRAGGAVGPSLFGLAAVDGALRTGYLAVAGALLAGAVAMAWGRRRLPAPATAPARARLER